MGAEDSLVDQYASAVQSFVDTVRQVRPEQWTDPTPCPDWDVRHLVNHLAYEQAWSVPLLDGATIAEIGERFDGDLLGPDPLAVITSGAAATIAAARRPGVLGRAVHLSFGDTPGSEYLAQLLADHLIHGWDLAVAIGADRTLDADLVESCAAWFAGREELYRAGGAIGAAVDAGPDATAQDRLIAAFGRDPRR